MDTTSAETGAVSDAGTHNGTTDSDTDNGGSSSDGAMPDPNASDEACAAAGGEFGILSRHSLGTELAEAGAGAHADTPGLVVGPAGLWATVVTTDSPDDPEPKTYGMLLDVDGTLVQPPMLVTGEWNGGTWWPSPDGVVVSHCNERLPSWSFLDAAGQLLSSSGLPGPAPAGSLGCRQPPSAAWVSDSSALVAWLDAGSDCPRSFSCARVTHANATEHGPVTDLFDAGDSGPGPTVSVAAGPDSAMLAMLRIDDEVELVTQPLSHDGLPTSPPIVLALPPSPEPGDSATFLEARVVANDDGTFFVFVGGWGFSMGRTHIGADGQVLAPLLALPPIVDIPVSAVYNSHLDGVFPRPEGWVALGWGVWGGQLMTLATALGSSGDIAGQVILTHQAAATATDGQRLWALGVGGGTSLYELGCVVP